MRTRSASTSVSSPGLSQIVLGMPSRPRSWTRPARRTVWASASESPRCRAAASARSATAREWPMVYGDFRSMKAATAPNVVSNSASESQMPGPGSAAMTMSQLEDGTGSPRISAAYRQNNSTSSGANCVPLRRRATWTAASIPPARWKTSTTSARFTSCEVVRMSSPFAPLGTPSPSQRSKVCSTLSRTGAEPLGQIISRAPMVADHVPGGLDATAASEVDPYAGPFQRRPASTEVAQDEHHLRSRAGQVDHSEVRFQCQVVTEPLGLLVSVDVTSDPRDHRGVVDDEALRLVEPGPVGQAQGDEALA